MAWFLVGLLLGVIITAAAFLLWPMNDEERREMAEFELYRHWKGHD